MKAKRGLLITPHSATFMLQPKETLPDHEHESNLGSSHTASDLEHLRKLLLGSKYQDLLHLQEEFSDHSHASEKISQVVSEAIAIRSKQDDSISNALVPSVEDAIRVSAKRDPKRLANALFPVMGPAIRESVAETVSAMMQQVNQLLENSFSARSIKWRFDAFRTNRSFAEVMLSETLMYQVEQVFLIHRESSLLINHHTSANAIVKDPDMVSSMLTAVTDFVKDSFVVNQQQNVKSIKFGQLNLLFEAGPHAIIVAAVRGLIPSNLQVTLREQIEELHRLYGSKFENYDGNAEQFPDTYEQLDKCLLSEKKAGTDKEQEKQKKDKKIPWPAIIALTVLVLLPLAWWLFGKLEQSKWNDIVAQLQGESGIVVLNYHKHDGGYIVNGLLDPLAKDPKAIIASQQGFDKPVQFNMEYYFSNESEIVGKRLRTILQAPETVSTSFVNGRLSIKGKAEEEWISDLSNKIPFIWGVTSFDTSELSPIEDIQLKINLLIESIEDVIVEFAPNASELALSDILELSYFVDNVRALEVYLKKAGQAYKLGILGFADLSGSTSTNNAISEQRARSVHQALVENGLHEDRLLAKGLGDFRNKSVDEKTSNCASQRCVVFEVYTN